MVVMEVITSLSTGLYFIFDAFSASYLLPTSLPLALVYVCGSIQVPPHPTSPHLTSLTNAHFWHCLYSSTLSFCPYFHPCNVVAVLASLICFHPKPSPSPLILALFAVSPWPCRSMFPCIQVQQKWRAKAQVSIHFSVLIIFSGASASCVFFVV
jgi:hypothetical protein